LYCSARKVPGRVHRECRLFFIQLYRWFPSVLNAITIVRPETLLRWASRGLSSLLACWRVSSRP
jgi:hypothetical protein